MLDMAFRGSRLSLAEFSIGVFGSLALVGTASGLSQSAL